MQINNFLFNYIKQNIPKEVLRENAIFEGEILEIVDNAILINIPGKGIIKAESEIDLEQYLGENIKFLIESKMDNLIEIKPIIEELVDTPEMEKDASINRILKHFNIKETELTKKLIESLMKYEIPLKEGILNDSVKTLEKLIQMIEIEDDQNLELIMNKIEVDSSIEEKTLLTSKNIDNINENNILEESEKINIDKSGENYFKYSEDESIEENLNKFKNLLDSLPEMEKEIDSDIKNIIVNSAKENSSKELTSIVKEYLSEFKLDGENKDVIEIVTFLTKNNIKPSLNNIKNLKQLIDDPSKFMEEIKELGDFLTKDDFMKSKNMGLDVEKPIENIEKNTLGNKIQEIIEEKTDIKSEFKKELVEIRNKTEFIKDMNNEMYYHMIPINYGEKELDGFINIMKNKKSKSKKDDKINIFINLDTNTLGNIKVSCQADGENLNIKIGLNEEDRFLFESGKEILEKRIEEYGYFVKNLIFVEENEVNILEIIDSEKDPLHFLDIKV